MLGSFLAAVMLCWLGWERFDPQRVIVWMTLLGLSTGVRTAMFFAYLRAPANQRTAERWEWRYWVTLMLSAAIWGWGAFAVMPTDDALGQTLIMLFAVGMSVSAVSCYSSYRNMTLVSMGLVLLPSTGWLLLQPSTLQQGIALAVLVFAWFVVSATQSLSSALTTAWRLKHEMQRAHRLAMVASCTDELTGLNNRRAFFDNASAQHVQCRDAGTFMAVLMLDVDHFKQINDTFGHAAGDQVLQRIGAAISASLRDNDIAGRLGGEEFAILLPNTPPDTAIEVAERLRALIAKLRVNDEHPVTASIGLAFAKAPATELGALLSSADSAMYLSKVSGRNRVTVAEPEQEALHKQH
ncbi:diguanylate cyclase [Pseudomonas putida]|uniref:diguanylate cyclase n=1 Tax=Pseudomonas hunanensis TaxID=1247546 RepID=A0ABD6N0N5_9PSED|nr:GGDEF domain-containing protein [Pseudomonas putida]NWL46714.1 GGDEF domain-containing protein [Pseudomonas hunanensis]MDD2023520.1 GGDEF domain-containing protein [Pseudomonas putida]NBA82486.1 diguanylate cyclase [Pseudomonas putida]PEI10233.1 GGDEF domain-containing protein [Pseudomonas putida]QNG11908.1 diguanylate cyclase [Pseudomonas putida]